MIMKAAVLSEINKPLTFEDIKIPEVSYGQILVKIKASGICRKQIEDVSGHGGDDPYIPHMLGHEGAGIVEKIGPGVTKVKPGDHVALSWIQGSGIQSKIPEYYSKDKKRINAGFITTFQEYTVTSENRVTKIPEDVPFDIASLIGCAVSTGIGAVINESKVIPGSTVAVFGAGGIGLNIIQGASLVNVLKIIAVDIYDSKLKTAKEFGATHTINAKKLDPIENIKNFTKGKGVDYAFESAGQKVSMEQAYQATNNQGIVNLVGNPRFDQKISIDALQTHYGKRLIGGHGGRVNPDVDFNRYIELQKAGKLKIDKLITHRYKLDEINNGLDDIRNGKVGRAIVEF
jgi:S-(hydroxymethyl)glutathione dehydrogenase / alcohol dehydrogenase